MRSLVRSSWIQTTPRKSKQYPYLVGMIVRVAKDNKQFIDTPSLISTVTHVAKNNECTLLTCHILAHVIENNELSLLMFHIWLAGTDNNESS